MIILELECEALRLVSLNKYVDTTSFEAYIYVKGGLYLWYCFSVVGHLRRGYNFCGGGVISALGRC